MTGVRIRWKDGRKPWEILTDRVWRLHPFLLRHQRRDGAGLYSPAARRRLLLQWIIGSIYRSAIGVGYPCALVVGPEGNGGHIMMVLWRARATGGRRYDERTCSVPATSPRVKAVLPWEVDRRGRPGGSYPRSTYLIGRSDRLV